jgi:hypothetical protein
MLHFIPGRCSIKGRKMKYTGLRAKIKSNRKRYLTTAKKFCPHGNWKNDKGLVEYGQRSFPLAI